MDQIVEYTVLQGMTILVIFLVTEMATLSASVVSTIQQQTVLNAFCLKDVVSYCVLPL